MQETRDAIEQGDRVRFMSIETRFHHELVKAPANPVMVEVMRLLASNRRDCIETQLSFNTRHSDFHDTIDAVPVAIV